MDQTRFDDLTRALRGVRSRRSALAAAAAALGVIAVGRAGESLAAPGGNGKGNGKGNGNGNGHGNGNGGGNSGGAPGHNKVGVCHRTGPKKNPSYVYLLLPPKAAQAHAKHHGDTIGVDLETDINNCGACGNVCAAPDLCSVATCTGGVCGTTAVTCDNGGNDCLTASCNPASGCVTTPVLDGTPCSGGTCQGGVCTP